MKVNSKNKGSKAERDLAKLWESWTGYKFARTPMSGGWAKSKDTFGDLTCTDDKHSRKFTFSVECKSYKGITFNDILKGNKSDILKFWEQATRDAMISHKIPILFMRENGMSKGVYFVITDGALGAFILKEAPTITYFKFQIQTQELILYAISSKDLVLINYGKLHKAMRVLVKARFK